MGITILNQMFSHQYQRLYGRSQVLCLQTSMEKHEVDQSGRDFFSKLKRAYDESETSFGSALRTVTDRIGSWFNENEMAQVLRAMKMMDPDFGREGFK